MAVVHLAGTDDFPVFGGGTLTPNATDHMGRYGQDVRSMLLTMEFLEGFRSVYTPEPDAGRLSLSWAGTDFASFVPASAETLATQVNLVRYYLDQRGDRGAEIVAQTGGVTEFFAPIIALPAARSKHLTELLQFVQHLAGLCSMPAKHALACRRPDELDSRLVPLIPTPSHGSLPSGHATQAAAISTVLVALLEAADPGISHVAERRDMIHATGHRIAVNRTVAGVHYPIDSAAGFTIGINVGRIIAALGQNADAELLKFSFDPNDTAAQGADFILRDAKALFDPASTTPIAGVSVERATVAPPSADSKFAWLWSRALDDINHLRASA
ncbi:phosphatase PAP2 family protein [uncultured Tateyamaria sp.]|uniref:phosphatase PAP2 family protein n=1 Tax=uncultured Tateyamaria sp. TaxID=455651 RepID=UPI00261D743F|nr:phosphatase PAP2 family protein [uncultured Tateyamaria sp.]